VLSVKIILFMGDFRFGGAEVVGVNLANAYCDLGYDVSLVVLQDSGDLKSRLNPKVNVESLNCRLRSALFPITSYLRKVDNGEVVIISTIRNFNLILSAVNWIYFNRSFKLIGGEANTYRQMRRGNFKRQLEYKIYRLLVPLFYSKSSAIIANSADVKDDLLDLGLRGDKAKIKVIGNPIAVNYGAHKEIKKPKPGSEPVVRIVSIGRLHEQKGYDLALKALDVLSERVPNLVYEIYGEGKLEKKLLTASENLKVKVNIRPPQNDLSQIFGNARVFLLTSQWEGFGNVVVEAMGHGITPVVVDCPGGPKDIVGSHFGFVSERDSEILADQIFAALNKPIDKNLLLSRSREYEVLRIAKAYLNAI
jgi:glycosyltransferase involved in cell wall biosynthesis